MYLFDNKLYEDKLYNILNIILFQIVIAIINVL